MAHTITEIIHCYPRNSSRASFLEILNTRSRSSNIVSNAIATTEPM
jgi:hypothetical protein